MTTKYDPRFIKVLNEDKAVEDNPILKKVFVTVLPQLLSSGNIVIKSNFDMNKQEIPKLDLSSIKPQRS